MERRFAPDEMLFWEGKACGGIFNARFRLTLPGTSSDRAVPTNSRTPPNAVRHSSVGCSSISNRSSPSAEERLDLRDIAQRLAIPHPFGAAPASKSHQRNSINLPCPHAAPATLKCPSHLRTDYGSVCRARPGPTPDYARTAPLDGVLYARWPNCWRVIFHRERSRSAATTSPTGTIAAW